MSSPVPSAPTTSARASWSGQIALGPLKVPVKAFPALVVPTNGPLHSVHLNCGARISQRKSCVVHGEVTSAEIGKAFELAADDSIPVSADEIAALAPTDDETIHVEHLTPVATMDLALFSGRALYLVPAHAAVGSLYAQALTLLDRQQVGAVGRMVLSDQRRLVAVRSDGRRLVLLVLHWPEHRRACPGGDVDFSQVSAADLRALEKALVPLNKSFAWEEYRDEGADRLNALIATKIAARSTTKPVSRKRTSATSENGATRQTRRAA
jgi:DNA end-binding protein Ku